ncbi:recombinase [Candidatus Saccharibacteria bacterium]|nr:recombinase [Candidatus Saccharibacteria bacterium]
MTTKTMNLAQKLVELRKCVPYLKKDSKSYGYNYVSGSNVLGTIHEKMNELGLLVYPEVSEGSIQQEGKSFIFTSNMAYVLKDAETGEEMRVPFYCTGKQDDPSKAFGSGLTYSERYFLLKFLNIPTDELDPDAFQKKIEKSEPKISREQAQELISIAKEKKIDANTCKEILKKHGFALTTMVSLSKFEEVKADFVAFKES